MRYKPVVTMVTQPLHCLNSNVRTGFRPPLYATWFPIMTTALLTSAICRRA
uniref:Uncharacterized protein n=1 Tax=Anguilla anguilla TaxID=7936 RepID=A0A0E9RRH0_ANGAN